MKITIGFVLACLVALTACNSDSNLPAEERKALIGNLADSLRTSRIAKMVTAEEIANTVCECFGLVQLERLQDKEELSDKNNPDSTALNTEMELHMACMLVQNVYGDPIQVDSAIILARQQCPERYAQAENFTRMMAEQMEKVFESE